MIWCLNWRLFMPETILFASHHADGSLLLTDFCALQYTYMRYQALFCKLSLHCANSNSWEWGCPVELGITGWPRGCRCPAPSPGHSFKTAALLTEDLSDSAFGASQPSARVLAALRPRKRCTNALQWINANQNEQQSSCISLTNPLQNIPEEQKRRMKKLETGSRCLVATIPSVLLILEPDLLVLTASIGNSKWIWAKFLLSWLLLNSAASFWQEWNIIIHCYYYYYYYNKLTQLQL